MSYGNIFSSIIDMTSGRRAFQNPMSGPDSNRGLPVHRRVMRDRFQV